MHNASRLLHVTPQLCIPLTSYTRIIFLHRLIGETTAMANHARRVCPGENMLLKQGKLASQIPWKVIQTSLINLSGAFPRLPLFYLYSARRPRDCCTSKNIFQWPQERAPFMEHEDRDEAMPRTSSCIAYGSCAINSMPRSTYRFDSSEPECRSKYSSRFSAGVRRDGNRQSRRGFSAGTRPPPTRCNFCKSCL